MQRDNNIPDQNPMNTAVEALNNLMRHYNKFILKGEWALATDLTTHGRVIVDEKKEFLLALKESLADERFGKLGVRIKFFGEVKTKTPEYIGKLKVSLKNLNPSSTSTEIEAALQKIKEIASEIPDRERHPDLQRFYNDLKAAIKNIDAAQVYNSRVRLTGRVCK